MKKKVKLFIPKETKIREDGIKVTKYQINPDIKDKVDLKVLAIDIKIGDVDYKRIIEFSKHENVKLYKVSSEYFETFWVTEDHSLIVYDFDLDSIRKAAPREILSNPGRYFLIIHKSKTNPDTPSLLRSESEIVSKLNKTCCLLSVELFVDIILDYSKNVAYDLTVEDYYTFATFDGVFVQDTVGFYFINTPEAINEVHDKKIHTVYHIKYLQNDKYIHVLRHEMLYAVYVLTSTEINNKKKPIEINSLKDFEIKFEYLNDIDRPVYIKDIDKTLSLGKVLLNKIAFDDKILIDFEVNKKNAEVINDLVYHKIKNELNEKGITDEFIINKTYLDKMHDIMMFTADFVSYTKYVPTIKPQDYVVYEDTVNKVKKLVNEAHIGKVLYDQIVDDTLELMKKDNGDLYKIYASGARASKDQISQIMVARGYIADDHNIVNKIPLKTNLLQGLTENELFVSAFGARKGLVDKQEATPQSGYLSRMMTMNSSYITIDYDVDDCGTDRYLNVNVFSEQHAKTLIGRYYLNELTGKLEKITNDNYKDVYEFCKKYKKPIQLRSPIYCKHSNFKVCKKCAGDFEWKNIGLLSGAFIAERTTQLILRVFHTSGIANIDIPEELYQLINLDTITDDGKIDPNKVDIKKLNKILSKVNNEKYKVYVKDDGTIVSEGILVNKDIITTVMKIKGFLTKTIQDVEKHRLYPDVVYHAIINEYLKHGFIKSLYIETVLSNLYVQQVGDKKIPIKYIDNINWKKVIKLSSKTAGMEFSKILRLIFEPNRNSLFNLLNKNNEINVEDIYYRLINPDLA